MLHRFILAACCVLGASTASGRDFVLQPLWIAGGVGSSVGEFGTPESVAIDSLGQVVVTDKGRMMLHVYDAADGTPLFDVGGLGTALGRFDRPNGIVVDPAGHILVVEQRNRRVQIFDRDYRTLGAFGAATATAGGFVKPMGIALDASGRIYVTDEARADVQVFDPSGRFLWRFGQDPRLDKVESIEVHPESQRIFVCDEGRSCINVYDLEGRYLHRFGSQGSGPGEFGNDTNAVRLDARGRIYVNDQGNARINVFAADTRFLASFYNASGGMESADGVALSERHNLLCVADQGNNRVLAFDLGEFGCRLDALELASPAAGAGGLVIATDSTGSHAADSLWADAPLWFEARMTGGDARTVESAIVHVRSGRDPRGVTLELRETAPGSNRLRAFLQLSPEGGAGSLATFDEDVLRFHLAGETDTVVPLRRLPAPRVDALSVDGAPHRLVEARAVFRWRFHDPAARRQQTATQLRLVRAEDGVEIWSPATLAGSQTSCAYAGPPLAPGVDYRLEVRLASGRSWSSPATLDLRRNTPPAMATHPQPASNTVVRTALLRLLTSYVQEADGDPLHSWFEVEANPPVRSRGHVVLDDAVSWNVPEDLAPENATIRWRVVHDDGYETVHGPWWSVSRNRVEEPPAVPRLESPANGARVHDAVIPLRWFALADPDPGPKPQATLEWCDSNTFETSQVHTLPLGDATRHTWTEALPDGEVFWRVRARDATGRECSSPIRVLRLQRTWNVVLVARTEQHASQALILGAGPGATDGSDAADEVAPPSSGLRLFALGADTVARRRDLRAPRDPHREPTAWDVRIHGAPGTAGRLELVTHSLFAGWEVEIAEAASIARFGEIGAALAFRFDAAGTAAVRVRIVARGPQVPDRTQVASASPAKLALGGTLRPQRGMQLVLGANAATPWQAELLDVRGRRILGAGGAPGVPWTWTGKDGAGRRLARGTYFLRVQSGGTRTRTRVLWLDP